MAALRAPNCDYADRQGEGDEDGRGPGAVSVVACGECAVGQASAAMSRAGADDRPYHRAHCQPARPGGAGSRQWHCGLSLLEAFGQGRGKLGFDGRFGVDEPLEVLAGQSEEPAGFGAPDGGETGVAVAASPVAGGRLPEVVTGAHGAAEPGIAENVVQAGQD